MPKAMSNIDTAFIENLTAMSLQIKDLCEMLADMLDRPEELHLLANIYQQAEKVGSSAIAQRQYIRGERTVYPPPGGVL